MITLTRIDPARKMRRFYLLDVQRTLLGEWAVIREWGRIGQGGQVRIDLYANRADATAAHDRQAAWKRRRGYALPKEMR